VSCFCIQYTEQTAENSHNKNIYRGKLQLLFEDFEVRMRYAIKTECKHKPEGARLCM